MNYLSNDPEFHLNMGRYVPYFQRFPGQRLLLEIEDFYISYGNWRTEYPENFHCFSLIRRVAEIAASSGGYLSDKEESELIHHMSEIKEGLYSGIIKHSHIPKQINHMILNLVEKNPKAKLIAHVIELEYFTLDRMQDQKNEVVALIHKVISKVSPHLSEMNAQGAAKEIAMLLTKLTKGPTQEKEIVHTLEMALKNWL